MIDGIEGITLEVEDYCALCKHHQVNHRKLFDPTDRRYAMQYYASIRDWGDTEPIGYLWFNQECDKYVYFDPDLVDDEVKELFT